MKISYSQPKNDKKLRGCLTVFNHTTRWEKRKVENYFYNALNHFIFEEAGGGAIRHLANRGYTAKQITESLSFPIPYEKVREAFTEHLLENGILLREKPGTGAMPEKAEYVREYDRYGKPSFRRVVVETSESRPERQSTDKKWVDTDFERFLTLYRSGAQNLASAEGTGLIRVQKNIYISCEFGADKKEDMLQVLDKRQNEYLAGICFTRRPMYHLLDRRMFDIAVKLWESGLPVGKVYIQR